MLVPPRVNPHPPPPPRHLVRQTKVRELIKSDWLYNLVGPEAKARLLEQRLAEFRETELREVELN